MMTDKLIEIEQERAEAIFAQLPAERQAAILERENAIVMAMMPAAAADAIAATPRPKTCKCFTLERGPRSGQFRLTVTDGLLTREYEIGSRRYDQLVALANSGNYFVEIYGSDFGVAWAISRRII